MEGPLPKADFELGREPGGGAAGPTPATWAHLYWKRLGPAGPCCCEVQGQAQPWRGTWRGGLGHCSVL